MVVQRAANHDWLSGMYHQNIVTGPGSLKVKGIDTTASRQHHWAGNFDAVFTYLWLSWHVPLLTTCHWQFLVRFESYPVLLRIFWLFWWIELLLSRRCFSKNEQQMLERSVKWHYLSHCTDLIVLLFSPYLASCPGAFKFTCCVKNSV